MSRRPAAGADRAAQNAQTLKALVKLEGNKVCADCKRNKHPRWASWNLGVFVCIRCSGIHRGMGTHISRVKSVDLDAWTDEQLQSVLKWGNTRANKYWEAKLAPGHVPSEAKIENFIRTKYDSKRWVMDGPMPDPSTLDADGDDDVPLNIVQEKAKIERSASQRLQASPPSQIRPQASSMVDLFGDDAPTPAPPVRPSTADIPEGRVNRAGPPVPPKPAKPQDSLLGLDFFGSSQTAGIGRPASAASNPTPQSNSRGDLKSSILSLYAAAPKPQPASQPQPSHDRQPSFGGLGSMASPPANRQDSFAGLTDAFGGLSFPSTNTSMSPPATQSPPSAFAGLGGFTSNVPPKATPAPPQVATNVPLSGGSFFDTLSPKPTASKPAPVTSPKSNGLDFSFTQNATPAMPTAAPSVSSKTTAAATSIPADLFAADDFGGFADSTPAPAPTTTVPKPTAPPVSSSSNFNSAFNLSSPKASTLQPAKPAAIPQSSNTMFDPWSSGNDSSPWGAPEPTQSKPAPSTVDLGKPPSRITPNDISGAWGAPPAKPAPPTVDLGKPPSHITPNDISGGWGAPISSSSNKPAQPPTVTADEDFGGWTSASTSQTPVAPKSGAGGFGGASDPFDNPWG